MLEETPEDLVIVSSEEARGGNGGGNGGGFATLLGPDLPPPPTVTLVQQQQQQQPQQHQQHQQQQKQQQPPPPPKQQQKQQQQQQQEQQPKKQPQQQQQSSTSSTASASSGGGWGGWLSASTTAFVSKALEKTRGGMESVIGSLDPAGLRALLLTGGDNRVALAVDTDAEAAWARAAVQRAFGRAVVGAVTDAPTGLAPTPLGFSSLRLACQQRLAALADRVRATAEAEDDAAAVAAALPVSIAACRGIVEPTPDHYCQLYCVCLLDPSSTSTSRAAGSGGGEGGEEEESGEDEAAEEFCAYSASLPVSSDQLAALRSGTPEDYPLRWSGFAQPMVGEAAAAPAGSTISEELVGQSLQQAVCVAIAAWRLAGRRRDSLAAAACGGGAAGAIGGDG